MKDLYNDTVELKAWHLIEMARMIRALYDDKESYLYKVFSDDNVYSFIHEFRLIYKDYFKEEPRFWNQPN